MVKRVYEQAQAIARRIQMERLIIDIALIIVALGLGYWIGFKACFEFLMLEVEEREKAGGANEEE